MKILRSELFDMLTLKAWVFSIPTGHWYDVGAETEWTEKAMIEHFSCCALLFSSLAPLLFCEFKSQKYMEILGLLFCTLIFHFLK